jgi:hypothetical protein
MRPPPYPITDTTPTGAFVVGEGGQGDGRRRLGDRHAWLGDRHAWLVIVTRGS